MAMLNTQMVYIYIYMYIPMKMDDHLHNPTFDHGTYGGSQLVNNMLWFKNVCVCISMYIYIYHVEMINKRNKRITLFHGI